MALNTECCLLSVIYAECRKQAHYAECHYGECRYAECHGAINITYLNFRVNILVVPNFSALLWKECQSFYDIVMEKNSCKIGVL